MSKVLLTGYSGFLGKAVLNKILSESYHVNLLGRKAVSKENCLFFFANIDSDSDYNNAFEEVDVVIHCAARAHVMSEHESDPLTIYRAINTQGALSLAKQAAESGVKRFIFISTVKVNGEKTLGFNSFTESQKNYPEDPYALSKFEAENELLLLSAKTDMNVVIIRPPLVYGPKVKGNFQVIANLVKKGYPLPFKLITNNKRSFVALENIVDFIMLCVDFKKTPNAANQIFIVSDGEDVSTAELFHKVAKAYGKKSRLFPFPLWLLRLGARLVGKQDMADRLLGSLQVDSSKARELLGWKPVITMDEQLKKIAEADAYKD